MKLVVASIAMILAAGCAQILGLDDTKLDRRDAPDDAPSVCDTPAVACTPSSGRTLCGQLITAGTGLPYRVPNPTGQTCTTTEGPCNLMVYGQSLATYFAGTIVDRKTGQVDDCGHFAIPDVDPAALSVAIGITGSDVGNSARLVLDLPAAGTIETGITAVVVPTARKTAWAGSLSIAESEIASGYLVRYLTTPGVAVQGEEVRVGGAAVGGPVTHPWAGYFTSEFDLLEPTATATTTSGNAFIAAPSGTFRIGGFHVGATCGRDGFQDVSNTLIYVVLKGC